MKSVQGRLKEIDLYLFDLDGTVYIEGKLIPGALETLKYLKKNKKKVAYLTNNATKSVKDYKKDLKAIGINAKDNEIFTAGLATINFLQDKYAGKSVYVVGTESLKKELSKNKIKVVEENPDLVLTSFDTEVTYEKLRKATTYIRSGLPYVATHPDKVCPSKDGMMPDAGAFIAFFYESTGRYPDYTCGKPYNLMAKPIEKVYGDIKPKNIAVVGDRLYTDIQFGINNKYQTIFVLSGEGDLKMYYEDNVKADYVFDDISFIKTILES